MKFKSMHSEKYNFKLHFFCIVQAAALLLSPSKTFADCGYNFVRLEVAQAYLKENPYIIAFYSSIEGQYSHLFKVEKVYMDGKQMTISGPVILSWKENKYRQRTYDLPDSGQIFTDELCNNYHFGYYKPMRAAFPLGNLLSPTGGTYNYGSSFWAFPEPEVIPDVEKGYSAWMEQLPDIVKEYCLWWYENASIGPPVFHDLINSVLSIPDGGYKKPPEHFVDYNHCPGEGCQYGEWTTPESITFFDKPNGAKKIGEIPAGETFTAITGNVYLTPMEIIVNESIEVYDSIGSIVLEPGRKYYVLSSIGEGHSNIWVNGRIMISSDSPYNSTQKWWVEIVTKSKKKGWILYPDNYSISGSDYLE
ncbi:MAG: hypothetical protein JW915_11840 [Chitinispirillaceae bacterium]|nr:hypothetical protein [Chitinispirillaceae bacterium]